MSTFLIISAGHSDLQFVVDLPGAAVRVWAESRDVHKWMLANQEQIEFIDDPRALIAFAGEERVDPRQLLAALEAALREGRRVAVIPAKLCLLVAGLDNDRPKQTLVLNTSRSEARFPREPIAAGPMIARWLQLKWQPLGAEGAPVPIVLDYLLDAEDMGQPADFDRAAGRIAHTLEDLPVADGDSAIIADTGGLAAFKEAVQVLAQMKFGHRVSQWRNPDRRTSDRPQGKDAADFGLIEPEDVRMLLGKNAAHPSSPQTPPASLPASPIGHLRLRLQVCDLVARGDFVSAHALASLAGEEPAPACQWRAAVKTAAEVLIGQRLQPPSDLNLPWLLSPRQPLPRFLVPALRVECALHSGHISEAVTHTHDFFEWCLYAAARQWIQRSFAAVLGCKEAEVSVNTSRKVSWPKRFSDRAPVIKLMQCCGLEHDPPRANRHEAHVFGLSLQTNGTDTRWYPLFEWWGKHPTEVTFRSIAANQAWMRLIDSPGLDQFNACLGTTHRQSNRRPDFLRNTLVHNGLAGAATDGHAFTIQDAIDIYENAGLWTPSQPARGAQHDRTSTMGDAFLGRELTQAVLSHLPWSHEGTELGHDFARWISDIQRLVRLGI